MSWKDFLNNKEEEQPQKEGRGMDQKSVAKPPVLFSETQQVLKAVEAKLGGTLITYYNSNAGSVCGNDASAMYEILKGKKIENAFLFIKSDGGSGIAALRIISTLRNYCKNITALIPANCASAATMMALGANEIVMGPLAYLTAVDTSLKHAMSPIDNGNERVSVSMDELNRVIKLWKMHEKDNDENPYKSLYNYIHPLVFGAVDRASSLSLKICCELLRYHMNDEAKIQNISERLNSDYRTARAKDGQRAKRNASGAYASLLRDGTARVYRLRREQLPRQQHRKHHRGKRQADLLSDRQRLVLSSRRAPLERDERRELVA